jgi:uncharacterized protein (TIGR03086 family)
MDTLDLRPAARTTADVVRAIRDDQLAGPTPDGRTVADLLDHVGGLCVAFTASARKERRAEAAATPSADGSRLEEGWRDRIAVALDGLAEAWTQDGAFDGVTQAGPIDLPAPQAAMVALDEVVVHGWDLAVATGQPYPADPAAVAACHSFVDAFDAPRDGGLFGPEVPVPDDAPALDRLIGATGRDPHWTP